MVQLRAVLRIRVARRSFCDMGPPSSTKMLVENLRACPVGAVCVSVFAESFYSEYYRSFVLEIFTASIAYHAVILLHTVHGPCSEVHILPTAAVVCRPYSCQVGRKIADSSMPMSGRLRYVESTTLEI
ncbi:hypothetical protein B296_00010775 [Ensete ventricosum]|uniref:Uncharacterized protein n=1 Tax=Ensete ventricosum TaxID=4639 RepID=A0A426ZP11_ENSVE|nr:hypothetical protein B296_00010775 [Ensete ventricosum]